MPLASVLGPQCLAILVELVAHPLQEQHPEDVFLEFRGIHVAPQDVARLEELRFQPGQGELGGFRASEDGEVTVGTLIRS